MAGPEMPAITAAVSPQSALRAAGFVSYRILLDGETPLGIMFPVTAAVFAATVAVRTIADAVKLKEAV